MTMCMKMLSIFVIFVLLIAMPPFALSQETPKETSRGLIEGSSEEIVRSLYMLSMLYPEKFYSIVQKNKDNIGDDVTNCMQFLMKKFHSQTEERYDFCQKAWSKDPEMETLCIQENEIAMMASFLGDILNVIKGRQWLETFSGQAVMSIKNIAEESGGAYWEGLIYALQPTANTLLVCPR